MAPFCPNLSDPVIAKQFEAIKLRTDIPYHLWDKHQGNILDIWDEIYQREEEYVYSFHPDSRIQEAMDKYGFAEITDANNPYVWDFENANKIANWSTEEEGDKKKTYNVFSKREVNSLVNKAKNKGYTVFVKEVYSKKGKGAKFSIRVFWDITKPGKDQMDFEKSSLGSYVPVSEDAGFMEAVTEAIGADMTSPLDLLDYLYDTEREVFNDREDLAYIYDLILKNKRKLRNTRIYTDVIVGNEDAYMLHYQGRIAFNALAAKQRPNKEYFIQSLLHEMVHSMTVNALVDPLTSVDTAFSDSISTIFNYVGENHTELLQEYGMKDVKEFVSELFSNRSFATELQKIRIDERSAFRRFFDNLLSWLGLKSSPEFKNVHDIVLTHFETYLKDSKSFGLPERISASGRILDHQANVAQKQIFEEISKVTTGNIKNKADVVKDALLKISGMFSEEELKKEHLYIHNSTGSTFASTTEYLGDHGYGISRVLKVGGLPQPIQRGSYIGTTVHHTLESNVNDVAKSIAMETGFKANKQVRKDLQKLIDDLIKETRAVYALSEVRLVDPETMRAGTADLVLIDKFGRIRIYDFKTKESGFRYYTKPFTDKKGHKETHSDQEKYHMQMSVYKYMIESTIGVEVLDMNVIMLLPEIETQGEGDTVIMSVADFANITSTGDFELKKSDTVLVKDSDISELTIGDSITLWSEEEGKGVKYTLYLDKVKKSTKEGYTEISYTFTPDIIKSIRLDRSYSHNGRDTFIETAKEFQGIYGKKPLKFSKRRRGITEDIDGATYYDEEMERLKVEQQELTDVEKIAEKAEKAIMTRLNILAARHSFSRRKSFEEFADDVAETDSATDTIVKIIKYAYEATDELWKEYIAVGKKKGATVDLLNKWKDYLVAYDTLDQVQVLLEEEPSLFNEPKISKILDKTIKRKNILKGLYESEGVRLIADWLTPYYGRIRREFQDARGAEYRKQKKILQKKGVTEEEILKQLGTEEQYVDEKMSINKDSLDKATFNLLEKELVTAARDIDVMSRWFDNMLDTSDAVSAALINAFMEADDQSRIEALEKRTEIVNKLRELEEALGKDQFEGEKDFYRFLLQENSDGEIQPYLLMPWANELHEDENVMRRAAYKNYNKKVASKEMKKWHDDNLSLDQEAFDKALKVFLKSLVADPDVSFTKKELKTLIDNQETDYIPITTLIQDEKISEIAGDIVLSWISENKWKYSSIKKEEFISKKWDKWMMHLGIDPTLKQWEQLEAVENSTHPEAVFYTYIQKLAKEADAKLPYTHALENRLPGVAKISSERIKEGQNPITYAKEMFKADLFVRPEDTHRGNKEITDEQGNPKYFLPIHYTAKLEPENQSYDIAGIYYKFWEAANDYAIKRQILSKMEMTKFFIDNRMAKRRDSLGNIIIRAARTVGIGDKKEEPSVVKANNIAAQMNDFFLMAVYGKEATDKSIINILGKNLDVSKFIDTVTKYTSMNLLAGNMVQGTANIILGEAMEAIDAIAGEHVTMKSLTIGTQYYMRNMPKMLGDIGSRAPNSTASLIIEQFDIMHVNTRYDTTFSKQSKVGQLLDSSSIYFVQSAGEHWMQSRFLFAMLSDKRAFNDAGEDIGSMLKQYRSENGKLILNSEVDLKKSKWTPQDQQQFKRKVKGLLSRMHGEYSELGKVAAQRYALGRLVYQFRKFIVPGIRRRYGRKNYIQRLDQFVEGNYRTTAKFAYSLMKDVWNLELAMMSGDWAALTDHEKANVRRTLSELAILIALYVLVSALFGGDDEEDEFQGGQGGNFGGGGAGGSWDADWLHGFVEYQAERLQTEIGFFSRPGETLKILRSPMASMSVSENVAKFLHSAFNFNEYYERGPWKGQRKITKATVNLVPLYRQYYKLKDVKEGIQWLR